MLTIGKRSGRYLMQQGKALCIIIGVDILVAATMVDAFCMLSGEVQGKAGCGKSFCPV